MRPLRALLLHNMHIGLRLVLVFLGFESWALMWVPEYIAVQQMICLSLLVVWLLIGKLPQLIRTILLRTALQ